MKCERKLQENNTSLKEIEFIFDYLSRKDK